MNVGDDSFWKQQQKRTIRQQRRTQYRHFVAVNWFILVIFLLQFDKILSFQTTTTKSICAARQRFTAGCDRIIIGESRNRNRINSSNRLFSTNTERMATKNDDDAYDEGALNHLARLGLPEPLLLGSASFTRKLILKEMGVPFSKFVRPIDEKAMGDRSENAPPRELVLLLANAKMDRLIQELKENDSPDDLPEFTNNSNKGGWVVLTGDQVVTCGGKILEKPESVEEAKEMVEGYAKSPPSTVGSVVLYHHPSGIRVDGVDTATIHFNPATLGNGGTSGSASGSSTLIDALIEAGEPVMSCAGGLMIEHPLTQHHVDGIDGTEDSVMGLSKDLVLRLLQELAEKLPKQKEP
jgi:septum formation protein